MNLNLKNVSTGTWVRTAALIIALINHVLVLNGKSVLPFESEDLEMAFTTVFTLVASIVAWWKNNSFTEPAQKADEVLKEEKSK